MEAEFKQKVYSCTLRYRGDILNTVGLSGITRKELQLLAFIHGGNAVVDVRGTGECEVVDELASAGREDGTHVAVKNEMGEYRRLARKYDALVQTDRGKKIVEECFKTRLDDFENVIEVEDAATAAARLADEADARAAVATAGEDHDRIEKARLAAEAQHTQQSQKPIGSRVFGTQQ